MVHSKQANQCATSAKMSNRSLGLYKYRIGDCQVSEVRLYMVTISPSQEPDRMVCVHYAVCDTVWEKTSDLSKKKQQRKVLTEVKHSFKSS